MMRLIRKAGAMALALGAMVAGVPLSAQVGTNYTFSQTTGTYTPISGGTLLVSQTTTTTSNAGSLDDGTTYAVPIPFTFTFDGVGYTTCTVTNNGQVSFGATSIAQNNYGALSSTAAYSGAIAAYSRDLQGGYVFSANRTSGSPILTMGTGGSTAGVTVGSVISGTGIPVGATVLSFDATSVTLSANATSTGTNTAAWVWNGAMRYETLGTTPNQVHVIQWSNMKPFGTTLTTVNGFRMNMQVRLYEADNSVEVVYGDCTPGVATSTVTAQIGLRGPNATFPANVNNRLNTKGVNDNWLNSAAGASNTSAMLFNNVAPANVIGSGLTFRWFDPPCTNPTGTATQTVTCGTLSYTVSGTVATMGDATSVDVVSSVHGTIATLVAPGAWGPTPSSAIGVNQTITLVHNINPLCNTSLGSFSGSGVLCNDDCANAYTLSCFPTPVSGTTTGSTVDAVYTDCGAGGTNVSQRGVWYKITGDNNQYTITTCDPGGVGYDTRLTVYSGSCGAFTCVAANDDMTPVCATGSFRSRVQFNALTGTDYYLFVHGFSTEPALSATGNFNLHISCAALCLPVPGNDVCASATSLTVDAPSTPGSNVCAGATVGNPSCESAFATLPDVYYSFVASPGGTNLVTVTLGTASSVGYAIYDACGGTQVACVANVTSGSPNSHTGLTPSATYFIRLESDELNTGTFDIQVTQPCQPAGTRTAVADCANNQFYIDVNITDLGTSTDLDITTDFLGDTEPIGVGLGVTQIGPYPSGTSVVVTLVHDNGGGCNLALASVSFTCPPANDACADAIAISCNSVTTGTTTGASLDAVGTCTTGLNTAGGVWYTFVGNGGTANLALCGSTYDTKMGVFTTPDCSTFTCVEGNDDDTGTNGLGVCTNSLHSSLGFVTTPGTTYYVLVTGFQTQTGNFTLELTCTGNNVPPCADNGVVIDLTTDDFGSETSWEILPVGNTLPVCSGSGYPNNASISVDCCLLDGCYTLAFFDTFGDGMCCTNGVGGYKLSTSNGKRIIDNVDDGEFTSVSSVANGFCVPIGATQLTIATCDKEDFLINDVVVSGIDQDVSDEYGVTDAISGYQFWLFDPDGSYSRRLFRSHASGTCVGTPAGPTRAAHMKFSCLNSSLPNVPLDLLLNMRVRPRVAGVYGEFGPACRVMVLSAPPACPTTQLDNNPLHAATTLSCGVTGKVVGASGYPGKLYPNIVAGANKYQYEFVQAGEGYTRTIATATGSYALTLANWATNPLLCGTFTYDVRVRVSFDGGANWCPYGPVCTVEITNNPPNNCTPAGAFQGGGLNTTIATEEGMNMYPNPAGDGRVTIELNGLSAEAMTANIEVFDLFGKRVASEAISTDGATELNKVMTLDNLATGMYMVHVTSGNKQFTDRLVIK